MVVRIEHLFFFLSYGKKKRFFSVLPMTYLYNISFSFFSVMCVCVLIVLAQEDLVALNIRGWTRVHSSIIMRWITIALSMLSISVSLFFLLYVCCFIIQTFGYLLRIHIHFNACFTSSSLCITHSIICTHTLHRHIIVTSTTSIGGL